MHSDSNPLPVTRPKAEHAVWRWATTQAEHVLASGDLATILRFYRAVHRLNQNQLGSLMGYDKTYISALELGKRTVDDITSRRRICDRLGLPPHVLGITDRADTDHRAMLQFGESTVRLAEIARQSGHSFEAVAELWPLVARLEARIEDGHAERDVLRLLAQARIGLGAALGNVLPEERLSTAARWTSKALPIADYFDDRSFRSFALRMHGNELRKAGLLGAAVQRLQYAAALAAEREARAAALLLLARAAGELHNGPLFHKAMREADALLDEVDHTSLVNPYAVFEIRLRGLASIGQLDAAMQLVETCPKPATTAAPQWHVIEMISVGDVRLQIGDSAGAADLLNEATEAAAHQRLPHQLQRIMRAAGDGLAETRRTAALALERLRQDMAA
ncbi:helix-turn-helix domain-containing protein [Streptomyces sp. NPDC018045]|uniref:helix-turn-helix domain-containing protein n=1 Tax=Streptomyces sp. NPDC018045 TaxID=3365037 RepID=UPI0037965D9A